MGIWKLVCLVTLSFGSASGGEMQLKTSSQKGKSSLDDPNVDARHVSHRHYSCFLELWSRWRWILDQMNQTEGKHLWGIDWSPPTTPPSLNMPTKHTLLSPVLLLCRGFWYWEYLQLCIHSKKKGPNGFGCVTVKECSCSACECTIH